MNIRKRPSWPMTIQRRPTIQQKGKQVAVLSSTLFQPIKNGVDRRIGTPTPIIAGKKLTTTTTSPQKSTDKTTSFEVPASALRITPKWATHPPPETTDDKTTASVAAESSSSTTNLFSPNTEEAAGDTLVQPKPNATTHGTPETAGSQTTSVGVVSSSSTSNSTPNTQESPPSLLQEEDSPPDDDVLEIIIPKWANYRKQEHNKGNRRTEKTESFSRVDAALQWRKRLVKAETTAWKEVLKEAPLIEKTKLSSSTNKSSHYCCEGISTSRQQVVETTTTTSATTTTSTEDNNNFEAVTMTASSSFKFELLPCTCLIAPTSCIWDRHALANVLVRRSIIMPSTMPSSSQIKNDNFHDGDDKIKKNKKKKMKNMKYLTVFDDDDDRSSNAGGGSTAVLWLPRFLPTFRETLSMLVDQIVRLPNKPKSKKRRKKQRAFFKRIKKKSKKRSFSFQRTILKWARHARQYQSIQIIVEDPGGPTRVRDAFLYALQEWRSVRGLPVSLVLILGKNNQSMWSASSSLDVTSYFTNFGMRLRHVRLDANLWISCFWKQLIQIDDSDCETATKKFFPISSQILRGSEKQYTQDHASLSRWVHDSLCQSITDFFSFRGSWVWNISSSIPSSLFAAWCCTHFTAKVLFSSSSRPSLSNLDKLQGLTKCQLIESRYNIFFQLQIQALLLQITTTTTLCPVEREEWHFGRMRAYDDYNSSSRRNNNINRLSILAGMHHSLLSLLSLESLPNKNEQRGEVAVSNKQRRFTGRSSEILKHYLIRKCGPKQHIPTESTATNGDHEDAHLRNSGQRDISFPSTKNQTLLNILILVNELLVLLERSGTSQPQDSTSQTVRKGMVVEKGISQLVDKLDRFIGDEMDKCMDEWKNANPLYEDYCDTGGMRQRGQLQEEGEKVIDDDDNRDKGGQLQAEGEKVSNDKNRDNQRHHHETRPIILRREIVDNLSNPARTMYALLPEKKSITRDKWLHYYGANEDQFSMGLRILSVYGLVRVKRRRGGKLRYRQRKVLLMKK